MTTQLTLYDDLPDALEAADILPEAHRYALKRAGPACNGHAKRQFLYHLISYYEDCKLYV